MTTTERREISNGPSKRDLDLALFEGKHVIFMTSAKFLMPYHLWRVMIEGLDRAEFSRNKWNMRGTILFHGSCKHATPLKTALKYVELTWYPHVTFQGFYDTQTRKGWIEF